MTELDDRYNEILKNWRAESLPRRTALLESFNVQFAFNSGRIENQAITYHDTRDVFENGTVHNFSGDVRSLFEIQNLRACAEHLGAQLDAGRAVDEELLLEAHRLLTQGTYDQRRWQAGERPGCYKIGDYVVGALDAGLPASEAPTAVAELLKEIKVCNERNVLTVCAYFHAVLEAIHPFADGNGRVGRALLNYMLQANNHPPVIVYDNDKLAYYGAMEIWGEDADLEPMKRFLKAELIKTWAGKL